MKIYISGQISGLLLHEARLNFAEAEKWLKRQGYEVMNPMVCNVYEEWKTWADYIIESIEALRECDGIYFMDNWVDSDGAKVEKIVAEHLELKVIEHGVFRAMEQMVK